MKIFTTAAAAAACLLLAACGTDMDHVPDHPESVASDPAAQALVDKYTPVRLTADLRGLSDDQRQVVRQLIAAGEEMGRIYDVQAYGNLDSLLGAVDDPALRRFVEINHGPWDRLDGNEPFLPGVGPKPKGANFYPSDIDPELFEVAATATPELKGLYTMVRRDAAGELVAIPYHEFFALPTQRASDRLREAAALAENEAFAYYLDLRADALLNDDYQASDRAWMDIQDNDLDVVIGPIETYEDQLYGYKAAHETFVLLKDQEWSGRLARFAELLPDLQRGIPVPDAYKQETPGSDSDLGAYDVLFVSGDANAGSKTIAINLPNDEEVQLEKGTRRLQLKNAMQAKFDKILKPIAGVLIAEDQRTHVTFDAFFGNTMFHEVAHGLGIKNTITGQGTVRNALRDHASTLEEGKADVLGLYMVTELERQGEWTAEMLDHYVTFVASIFRSIRFGVSSAHGRANLIRFNFFREMGAFTRHDATGTYRVDPAKMAQAVNALSERIVRLQGDGDYDAVAAFVDQYLDMPAQLQADLDRLADAGIPVDIVYEQGPAVLGLD